MGHRVRCCCEGYGYHSSGYLGSRHFGGMVDNVYDRWHELVGFGCTLLVVQLVGSSGIEKVLSVGVVGAFGDGSNNFFLDFTQFSYILLGGTSIDGEAVDKMRVHH